MKKILLFIVAAFVLASCGWSNKDIINPDADYVYFYGATCPHCVELNKQIKDAGILEELSIEKREVYYNQDNQKKFQEVVDELGLPSWEAGVPFVLEKSTGTHVVGTDGAFEMLSGSLK